MSAQSLILDGGDTLSQEASPPAGGSGSSLPIETEAREAAKRGEEVFNAFWKRLTPVQRPKVQAIGEELRKLMAEAAASAE